MKTLQDNPIWRQWYMHECNAEDLYTEADCTEDIHIATEKLCEADAEKALANKYWRELKKLGLV